MHKLVTGLTDIERIRPFDVVHFDAGRLIAEGVVWQIGPRVGVSRIAMTMDERPTLSPIELVDRDLIYAISRQRMPIQTIEDEMVACLGGEKSREHVRNLMLDAAMTTALRLEFLH